MQLSHYDHIYLIGIGGIGMSALARWFNRTQVSVKGYDAMSTEMTSRLSEEGIAIHFDDDITLIPKSFTKDNTLVIYTPAIPDKHTELSYFRNNGFCVLKRSEVLGLLVKNFQVIAVAGTHGKTTTSALISHILKQANMNMVALLGGVMTNYGTNFLVEGEINEDTLFVVEADEFDRSFLTLFPTHAVVTSIDSDHLDIYGHVQVMYDSFSSFIKQIKPQGLLIAHHTVQHTADHVVTHTYGLTQGTYHTEHVVGTENFFEFDLLGFSERLKKIQLSMPGLYNIENAIAAILIAHQVGVTENVIREALRSFQGIKRRFEFILSNEKITYIDDYAHHPTEIDQFITSLRFLYPNKKITLVFQPHLYTRTQHLAKELSQSLSKADAVLLMDIYPARENPIPGVDSGLIFQDITSPTKIRCDKKNVLQKLTSLDVEVLATVGAGDIDTCVDPIKKLMNTQLL